MEGEMPFNLGFFGSTASNNEDSKDYRQKPRAREGIQDVYKVAKPCKLRE